MTAGTGIDVLRVYDDDGQATGYRVLVDRLWPRGIKKEELRMDAWAKDLAPSTALRSWYGHESGRFLEFSRLYTAELRSASAVEALPVFAEQQESGDFSCSLPPRTLPTLEPKSSERSCCRAPSHKDRRRNLLSRSRVRRQIP